jgi:hypothetical protein
VSTTQKVFEALMRSKGHSDLSQTSLGKYRVASIQMRWVYFQMGWEMRGAVQ